MYFTIYILYTPPSSLTTLTFRVLSMQILGGGGKEGIKESVEGRGSGGMPPQENLGFYAL